MFPCWRGLVDQIVFALIAALAIAVLLLKLQPFVSDSDDLVSTLAQVGAPFRWLLNSLMRLL